MLDVMRNPTPAQAAVQREANHEREECWREAESGGSLEGSSVPWQAELPAPPEEPKPGAKRLPLPHEATDRVHQLLGQMAAKELQCQRLREALRWYGDEARAVSKKMAGGAHQAAVLASLTVVSLDSGRRSGTALTPAGDLVADGAARS